MLLLASPILSILPMSWSIGAYALGVLLLLWVLHQRAYGRLHLPHRDRNTTSVDASGSVYVLTNPEHPGLVKIGYTTRDVAERVRELSAATGVPQPFTVAYEAQVPNPQAVEEAVHRALADRMVNPDREFFEVPVRTAVRTIRRAPGETGNSTAPLGPRSSFGLSSLAPSWLRAPLETGLGLVLSTGALLAFIAIVLSAPVPADGPSTWTHAASDGSFLASAEAGVLGPTIATIGEMLGPGFLGVSGLPVVGMAGLWGYAMLRQRSRRPLRLPAALSLITSFALAGTMGWMGHRTQASAALWTSGDGAADALQAWSGALGTGASGWLRTQIGPPAALIVLIGLLAGSLLLGVWWAWPRSRSLPS